MGRVYRRAGAAAGAARYGQMTQPPQGRLVKSVFYLVTQFTKSVSNPLNMVSLNFQTVLPNGAACATLRLQPAEQSRQVAGIRIQAANDCD